MDANVMEKAEELAKSIAGEARTIDDLNSVLMTLMKSALEQRLCSELRMRLREEKGRRSPARRWTRRPVQGQRELRR